MGILRKIGAISIAYSIIAFLMNIANLGLLFNGIIPSIIRTGTLGWLWNPLAMWLTPRMGGDIWLIGGSIAAIESMGLALFWSGFIFVIGIIFVTRN